jgi:G3E family GTPase
MKFFDKNSYINGIYIDKFNIIFVKSLTKHKRKFYDNGIWTISLWLIGFLIYGFITYDPTRYYSIVVGLNYPQAAKGKYPNGSNFSPSDIVSTSVLEKVWTENHLSERGVKFSDFQRSFTAIPSTSEVRLIEARYSAILNAKNLSRVDIEKIEADYKTEMEQTSTKSIKLIMDSGGADYSTSEASKILNDVALAWSRISVEKLGVLMTPVSDSLALNNDIKNEAPIVIVNYLIDFSDRAKNIISNIRNDPNSNAYRDEKSGLNLGGLSAKLSEISNYQIDHLDVFLAMQSSVTEVELMQTRNRIQELQEERKVLMMNAESVKRALADYAGAKNQNANATESKTRSTSDNESAGVQFNSEAINKLFNLATESKDAQYRQQLTADRLRYENLANDYNLRIAKLERRLGYMQMKGKTSTSKGDVEFKAQVNKVWSNLQEVVDTIARIQLQVREEFTVKSGLLYTQLSETSVDAPGKLKLLKVGLISLGFTIFFVFIFTIFQLLLKNPEEENMAH